MKKISAVVLAAALMFTISGCRELGLDELIEQRQKCLDADGEFIQWRSGWGDEKFRCDLSTSVNKH